MRTGDVSDLDAKVICPKMPDLWTNPSPDAWQAAPDAYATVIAAQQASDLQSLDFWYLDSLPTLIASRQPPYVTLDELIQATRWKMKRGVWRQRNLLLVSG